MSAAPPSGALEWARDRLPEYVLGTLPAGEIEAIERALAAAPGLRREVDLMSEALAAAVLPTLMPAVPPPRGRSRLLAALDGASRFAPFLAALTLMFDLSADAVQGLLARIDDHAAWKPGFAPGLFYFDFAPGPRLAGADAGFIRLEAGGRFPRHSHLGDELSFVLEGQLREGDQIYGPGSLLERGKASAHDFTSSGDRALVLVTVHEGISLG